MSELKTLKDMTIEFEETGRFYVEDVDLKAEAVKWVKCSLGYGIGEFESMEDYERIMNWIKYFFNLTEEDLQEEKAEK